jgi:hypothetical protein
MADLRIYHQREHVLSMPWKAEATGGRLRTVSGSLSISMTQPLLPKSRLNPSLCEQPRKDIREPTGTPVASDLQNLCLHGDTDSVGRCSTAVTTALIEICITGVLPQAGSSNMKLRYNDDANSPGSSKHIQKRVSADFRQPLQTRRGLETMKESPDEHSLVNISSSY